MTPELDSIKPLAFRITAAWEGGDYDSYQNVDAGIVSYGRFQFTLAGGSLLRVIESYLAKRSPRSAPSMLLQYLDRVRASDPALRHDAGFKDALEEASTLDAMHQAQDESADALYWQPAMIQCAAFGITTALGRCYAFDTGVQLGPQNANFANALRDLGGQASEQALVTRAAGRRRDELYHQAERDNLPGLKARGDFWVNLCAAGDWNLRGQKGVLTLKPGVKVAV